MKNTFIETDVKTLVSTYVAWTTVREANDDDSIIWDNGYRVGGQIYL